MLPLPPPMHMKAHSIKEVINARARDVHSVLGCGFMGKQLGYHGDSQHYRPRGDTGEESEVGN